MKNKTINNMKILIAIMLFVYGIICIIEWKSNLYNHTEGDTFEEIASKGVYAGDYVSFYIDDYVNKEKYVENNIEYEIYTIVEERDISSNIYYYIQLMVKDEETKQKLNNIGEGRVYFRGVIIEASNGEFGFGKEWETGVPKGMNKDYDKLCANQAIMEAGLPSKGYGIYIGIVLIISSIIVYRRFGGIQACVPDVEIKANKYDEYNSEYNTQIHNIRNEWLNEKDNLKRLKKEQLENKKVDNIMTVIFSLGLILLCSGNIIEFLNSIVLEILAFRVILMMIFTVTKILGIILMLISIGGVWSRFINSSHKLAIYIAHKKRKRSLYLEIEACKKNIRVLERIMEENDMQ